MADLPYKLELLDPAGITVRNLRDAQPSKWLIDSVRRDWLLQPIGVLRTPDGELVLRFGERRLRACIVAGRQAPALVVDGTSGTPQDEIDRIFEQLEENDNREDLTTAERVGAVATLFDLGATTTEVARRTGYKRDEIAAARKAAASETARTLASHYPVDLAQAAVLAEFNDSPEIAAGLAETARDNPAQFTHAAQLARDERAEAAMLAEHTAKLTAQGYTVSAERQHWEDLITNWAWPDGKQLTPENHKDCAGSIVVVRAMGHSDSRVIDETWYCMGPRDHGHKKFHSGQPEKDPEEASAERSATRENNKRWRSAATVRQQWLRDVLLQRKTVPDGASVFIARTLAVADSYLIRAFTTMNGRHRTARELLGGIGKETWDSDTGYSSPLADSVAGVPEHRAQLVTLALVIGALEELTADPQTLRAPAQAARNYLMVLESWGYTLSDTELRVTDPGYMEQASADG